MQTTHLYLSGPMTGLPDFNKPAFHRLARELRAKGHAVLNPAELDGAQEAEKTWAQYLARDLGEMLAHCNAVAVMDGWEESRGAVLECAVAAALGMPVYRVESYLDAHLNGAPAQTAASTADIFGHAARFFSGQGMACAA